MDLNFNPNAVPVTGPAQTPPPSEKKEEDSHDPTASTLSQSLAEALMVQFLPNWPILQNPDQNPSNSINQITAMVATDLGKIGTDMWNSYIQQLQEQKDRIATYLKSSAYQNWVQDHTLQGQLNQQITLNTDNKSSAVAVSNFDPRINNAVNLWTNTIDGVTNYIDQNRDVNPSAALFMVASFAIGATYIGDYVNVVDVASTNMVTVTPIQDIVKDILPLVPQTVQDQFALTVNLFAIGLINFANADAILKSGQQDQRAPSKWENAVSFAHKVSDAVDSDMINQYLMAMLVNNMEQLAPTQDQRTVELGKLTVLAKAIMLSVAIAALLKASAPDVPLSKELFLGTLSGNLQSLSQEDQALVNELLPLVQQFNALKAEESMSQEFWTNIEQSLGSFFDSNPSTDDLITPSQVYASIVKNLFQPDIQG